MYMYAAALFVISDDRAGSGERLYWSSMSLGEHKHKLLLAGQTCSHKGEKGRSPLCRMWHRAAAVPAANLGPGALAPSWTQPPTTGG
jgi:hypothetical protein